MGKASLNMLGTLGLLSQAEGLSSLSPTRARRRHAYQVYATMAITAPREQEDVCRPSQGRTAPGSRGIVTLQP